VVGKFKRTVLGLHAPPTSERIGHLAILGLESFTPADDVLAKRALACYAIMMASNNLRHTAPVTADEAFDALRSHALSAADAHPFTTKLLRGHFRSHQQDPSASRFDEVADDFQEDEILDIMA